MGDGDETVSSKKRTPEKDEWWAEFVADPEYNRGWLVRREQYIYIPKADAATEHDALKQAEREWQSWTVVSGSVGAYKAMIRGGVYEEEEWPEAVGEWESQERRRGLGRKPVS